MDFRWYWCVNIGSSVVATYHSGGVGGHGGGCACAGAGGVREISVPATQFCHEPKIALKSLKKKKKRVAA